MSATTKLPVLRTIIAAYAFLFGNWREALRVAWLPIVASVGFSLLMDHLPSAEGWPVLATILYGWAIWIAYVPIVAIAVVPWHRFILMGRRAGSGMMAASISPREARYTLLTVVVTVIAHSVNWVWFLLSAAMRWISDVGGYTALFNMLIFLTFLVTSCIGVYLFSVLSLALPATAVDRDDGLRHALDLGRRNGWRLAVLILVAVAPFYAVHYLYNGAPDSLFAGIWGYVWMVLYDAFYILQALAAATILSLSYRSLGGLRGNAAATSVIPPSGGA